MTDEYSRLPENELRSMLKNSSVVLHVLTKEFSARPDILEILRRLTGPGDILATITELAEKDPELMRLALQAGAMSLINLQGAAKVRVELRRRRAAEN